MSDAVATNNGMNQVKMAEVVVEPKTLPVKVVVKLPKSLSANMTTTGGSNDEHLLKMMSKLTVTNSGGQNGCVESDDSGNYDSEDDNEIDYAERGPMTGRKRAVRNHPYDCSSSSDTRSGSSGIDSESSESSSPGASPQHSSTVFIPPRPCFGSAGTVRVSPPSPVMQGPSTGERNRSARLSGGTIIVSEDISDASPVAPLLPSPHFQSSVEALTSVIVLPSSSSCSDSSSVKSLGLPSTSQFSDQSSSLSPFPISYRDPPSSSPASVSSCYDDCSLQPSPESDGSMFSPVSNELHDIGATTSLRETLSQTTINEILAASSSSDTLELESWPLADVNFSDSDTLAFSDITADEYLESIDLDMFDPPSDFADIMCDSSPSSVSLSQLTANAGNRFFSSSGDSQILASINERPGLVINTPVVTVSGSPINIATTPISIHSPTPTRRSSLPVLLYVPSPSTGRTSPISKFDAAVQKHLNSYKKIVPKPQVTTPVPEAVVPKEAVTMCTKNPTPIMSHLPQITEDAVMKMRSLFSGPERNAAVADVDMIVVQAFSIRDEHSGDTFLHRKIYKQEFAIVYATVRRMVEHHLSLDVANNKGQTPLFIAVLINNPVVVEFLLHHGANPECVCRDGTTLMHVVAFKGDTFYDTASILLNSPRQIDFGLRNAQGLTALHFAVLRHSAERNSSRLIELFLRKGASLNYEELSTRKTPLHLAVECGHLEIVKQLCESCSTIANSINAKTYDGHTPLHFAAGGCSMKDLETQVDMIKLLLQYGADPNQRNKDRRLPRDLVSKERSATIKSLLNSRHYRHTALQQST